MSKKPKSLDDLGFGLSVEERDRIRDEVRKELFRTRTTLELTREFVLRRSRIWQFIRQHLLAWLLTTGLIALIGAYYTYLHMPRREVEKRKRMLTSEIAFRLRVARTELRGWGRLSGELKDERRQNVDNALNGKQLRFAYGEFSQRPLISLLVELNRLKGSAELNTEIDRELARASFREQKSGEYDIEKRLDALEAGL